MNLTEDSGRGLSIRTIEAEAFRDFARQFGTSEEIGPIATAMDKDAPLDPRVDRATLGLYGCETLCAAACLVTTSTEDGAVVCKLDSVIVDQALRRRSLAKMLVTSTFSALATQSAGRLDRVGGKFAFCGAGNHGDENFRPPDRVAELDLPTPQRGRS